MSEQQRVFSAVALSAVILFGWQFFFAPQADLTSGSKAPIQQASGMANPTSGETNNGDTKNPTQVNKVPETEKKDIPTFSHEFENSKVIISSDLTIKDFTNSRSDYQTETVLGKDSIFRVLVFKEEVQFTPEFSFTNEDGKILGVDEKNNLNVEISEDEHSQILFKLKSSDPIKYGLYISSHEYNAIKENVEAKYGVTRKYLAYHNKEANDFEVGDVRDGGNVAELKWIAVDFNYHIFGMSFTEATNGILQIKGFESNDGVKNGRLFFFDKNVNTNFEFSVFNLKKDYDYLTSLGNGLRASVDFGVFGILAIPILRGIQYAYNVFPNYGIAIIIVTLLIRLLTFPLQYKSVKGMKKMQLLQPEMAKIKEKFKDDPQAMQRETMALFKKSGANPLGGCLPLILQMPFFFAFYQVLYNAVELVDAPFAFWIQDLSAKDPFYVLPILMALIMFGQQKIMPTGAGMDPTQKKIMMFMPLIFGFIFKDMPSGLTLYIITSTIFGIGQQYFVNKNVTA